MGTRRAGEAALISALAEKSTRGGQAKGGMHTAGNLSATAPANFRVQSARAAPTTTCGKNKKEDTGSSAETEDLPHPIIR